MRAFLAVLFVIAVSCLLVAVTPRVPPTTTQSRDIDSLYVFRKHDSTGLCFFGEDWNSDGLLDAGTAGEVPCTPEVEKWIADHRRAR